MPRFRIRVSNWQPVYEVHPTLGQVVVEASEEQAKQINDTFNAFYALQRQLEAWYQQGILSNTGQQLAPKGTGKTEKKVAKKGRKKKSDK